MDHSNLTAGETAIMEAMVAHGSYAAAAAAAMGVKTVRIRQRIGVIREKIGVATTAEAIVVWGQRKRT